MFNDYLKQYSDKYEQVLMVDIRDMIFQKDFFAIYQSQKNYVGYAAELLKIKDEPSCNIPWLIRLIGEVETQKIWENRIICSGTIWGTVNEMISVLDAMTNTFNKFGVFWGADQAAENYVIYNNLMKTEKLIANLADEDEPIYTNALIDKNTVTNKYILNLHGNVPAIVHQYDRHKEQVELANRLYRLKSLNYDDDYKDSKSILDMVNSMLYRQEIMPALEKLIHLADNPSDLKSELNRVTRLIQYLEELSPANAEVLGHLLTRLILKIVIDFNVQIEFNQVDSLWNLYSFMNFDLHAVDRNFEGMLLNYIIQLVKFMQQNNQPAIVAKWTERLNQTGYKF